MKNPQGFSKFTARCQLGPLLGVLSVVLSVWLSSTNPNLTEIAWLTCSLLALLAGWLLSFQFPEERFTEEVPAKSTLSSALLIVVFVFGIVLRLSFVDFGMPYFNHPDEGPKARIVEGMLETGSWNPHYFLHPSLLLYLAKLGEPLVEFAGLQDDVLHDALFAGRVASALAGGFSILLVYLIGKRLFSWQTGLGAAALLAFSPLHVTCSRYMKEDALCLFFILAAVLAALKGLEEKKLGFLLFGGFLSGCAAGAKYTGVLSGVLLVILFVQFRRKVSVRQMLAALLFVPVGFLVCCPYALLDADAFVRQFLVERNHMKSGHQGVAITAWEEWWMYHWSRSIVPGFGVIGSSFALLGAGLQARKARSVAFYAVLAFLCFYLPAEWVKAKPPPQPERYVLCCLPFLAILAAEFFDWLRRIGYVNLAQLSLFFALLLPAGKSVLLASELSVDTRQSMREWMLRNIPAGSSVLIEASYSPHLDDTPFDRHFLKASKHPALFGKTAIQKSGYEYLLVNSFSYERYFSEPEYSSVLRRRFENIFESFELKKEFKPRWGSYGFHNPTVRLYVIPKRGATNAQSD